MATVTRSGWTVDNPSQSSSIIRANVPTKFAGGLRTNVLVKSNISNGNYDVYQPSVFGDRLIYSRNASDNKLTIHDRSIYDEYFNKSRPIGQQNFDVLDKQIRIATYDQAQLNTGTDPVNNRNFENIKKSAAYKSLANIQKPGQRLPGADTPSPADGDADATAAAQQAAAGEVPTEAAKVEIGATAPGTRTEFSTNLRYPLAMSNNQDVVKFTLVEFKPSTLNLGTNGGVSTFTRQGSTTPKGTIFLAIPGGISDTNTAGWGDDRMNPIEATLANVGLTAISKGIGEGMAVLSQTASNVASDQNTNQDVKDAIKTAFASAAMQGDAQKLLTRTTGAVFNPNLELLFTGPELRSFSFTFKMSARNQPEADMIIRIIRTFKQAMAPQRTLSSIYVKAPLTFLISYHHKNEMHKKIGKIKECALVSLTTNYTPEGQYATYQDGTMLSYELQMQFKELEPVFNNDYTGPDTEIGF